SEPTSSTTSSSTSTTESTSTSTSSSTSTTESTSTSTSTSSTSTSTSSTTSTSNTTTTTLLGNHFQRYETKPATIPPTTVTETDRFGTQVVTLRYPHRLCAPADKNGEGIVDPVPHLTGYETLR